MSCENILYKIFYVGYRFIFINKPIFIKRIGREIDPALYFFFDNLKLYIHRHLIYFLILINQYFLLNKLNISTN